MEEILEELRELAEDVPVPLDLPEHDDTVEAEEQMLLPLPRDYREFLLTASDIIYGHLEPATVADSMSHTYLPEMAATAWANGLPRDVFPICEAFRDGEQVYYAMDPEGSIKIWTAGDFTDEEWETIWYWVRDVWMSS